MAIVGLEAVARGAVDFDLPTVRALMRLAIEGEADRKLGAKVRAVGLDDLELDEIHECLIVPHDERSEDKAREIIDAIASALREEGESK